jgi:predicted lysophospholipase L1 biosynthesis ABC-type transport system permease subunit
MIINETLAGIMWPGQDPLGRIVRTSGRDRRVVGVVGSVRYFGLDREVDAEMYMPLRQPGGYQSVDLVVRGAIPPTVLESGVRAALRRVDPTLPIAEFRTMQELVDRSVFARRFMVLLVAGFAAFGLVLSAFGIYAVISYSVSQRTQEIGIRMALGATPGGVRARILEETGVLVALGIAIGLPMSWMAGRAIRGLLFNVGSSDPLTFAAVLFVLASVASLAGYLPARRATRVDPAIALRPR